MAVSTFFVISGFLISLHIKHSDGIMSFAYKRMIRLYPVYWVAIIVTSIFTFLWLPERASTFGVILVNFTMLQGFLSVPSVDGVYWTLIYQILFYAVIGIIIYLKQMKNISSICLGWLCLSIVLSVLHSFVHNIFLTIISVVVMPSYSQMFILGIAMYSLYRNPVQRIPHVIIGLCILNQYLNFGIGYSLFFLIVTALFYCIAFKVRFRLFFQEQMIFISSISYPLYLIHQFIGYGIIKHMENRGFVNEIFLFIPITISILLAYLLHRFVENPSAKALSIINPFNKLVGVGAVIQEGLKA